MKTLKIAGVLILIYIALIVYVLYSKGLIFNIAFINPAILYDFYMNA